MSIFMIDRSELSLQVMITFAHFLWQACVIGFVLFVFQQVGESLRDSQMLRRRRGSGAIHHQCTDLRGANVRYTIVCLAFGSLPICAVATFAWVHQSRGPILLATSEPAQTIMTPAVVSSEPTPTLESIEAPALPTFEMTGNTETPSLEPLEKIGSKVTFHVVGAKQPWKVATRQKRKGHLRVLSIRETDRDRGYQSLPRAPMIVEKR
jgi:hypothetical protein